MSAPPGVSTEGMEVGSVASVGRHRDVGPLELRSILHLLSERFDLRVDRRELCERVRVLGEFSARRARPQDAEPPRLGFEEILFQDVALVENAETLVGSQHGFVKDFRAVADHAVVSASIERYSALPVRGERLR